MPDYTAGTVGNITVNPATINQVSADGKALVVEDYNHATAIAEIPNNNTDRRVGSSPSVPSSTFMLLSNVTSSTNPINFPATQQQMRVVSTSANDTSAGTGAQQVTITYFNNSWVKKTEIISLNGKTPVSTVGTDFYRIDKFEVNKVGTGLFSAGDIKLQSTDGNTLFEQVDAGTNVFRTAIHYVPNGYKTVVTDVSYGASTVGGVIFILEASSEDGSGNIVTSGKMQVEIANSAITKSFVSPLVVSNPNGKVMFVALVVKGRASNQTASGSFVFHDMPIA